MGRITFKNGEHMQRNESCSQFLISIRPWLSQADHRPNYWSQITVKMFQVFEAESYYRGLFPI